MENCGRGRFRRPLRCKNRSRAGGRRHREGSTAAPCRKDDMCMRYWQSWPGARAANLRICSNPPRTADGREPPRGRAVMRFIARCLRHPGSVHPLPTRRYNGSIRAPMPWRSRRRSFGGGCGFAAGRRGRPSEVRDSGPTIDPARGGHPPVGCLAVAIRPVDGQARYRPAALPVRAACARRRCKSPVSAPPYDQSPFGGSLPQA